MKINLKQLRLSRGLSQNDLACATGIPVSAISGIENGKVKNELAIKRLSIIRDYLENSFIKSEPVFIFTAFSFDIEHLYSIKDISPYGLGRAKDDFFDAETGYGCVFIYTGKHGKHHVFKSVRGGWSRTYTDAQLIGKSIQEVIHES